jgi:peptidoglycan/LPS O-acetylase OafA/YrhL
MATVPAAPAPSGPAPERPKSETIPSLDGFRAFFVLLVFVAHLAYTLGFGHVLPGSLGVTGFFLLSGYLITTLLRQEAEQSGGINIRHFYMRRVLRILPPFYLTLALAVAMSFATHHPPHGAAVLAQAVHLSNYYCIANGFDDIIPGTSPFWSLAVEEHFYLVFPLLYLGIRRVLPQRGHQALFLSALCLLVMAWRVVLVYHYHVSSGRLYMGSDTRFDSLLFGCMLALYGNPYLDGTRVPEKTWKWLLFPLGCLGILFSCWFHHRDPVDAPHPDWFSGVARNSVQGISFIPIFVCAVRYPGWAIFPLFRNAAVVYVGRISYTLYLAHDLMMNFYTLLAAPVGILGSTVAALWSALAALLYSAAVRRWIELPCARLSKRFRPAHLAHPATK